MLLPCSTLISTPGTDELSSTRPAIQTPLHRYWPHLKFAIKASQRSADSFLDNRVIVRAIEHLLKTKQKDGSASLNMGDQFLNHDTGMLEDLTVEEWEAIMSWHKWWESIQALHPVILSIESAGYTKEPVRIAGTRDLRLQADRGVTIPKRKGDEPKPVNIFTGWPSNKEVEIKGQETVLIDYKTSQHIWPSHEVQLSFYRMFPDSLDDRLGILQIGYSLNRAGWKLTEVIPNLPLALSVYEIWKRENPDAKPSKKTYPVTLKI